jgi:hypothetical protein
MSMPGFTTETSQRPRFTGRASTLSHGCIFRCHGSRSGNLATAMRKLALPEAPQRPVLYQASHSREAVRDHTVIRELEDTVLLENWQTSGALQHSKVLMLASGLAGRSIKRCARPHLSKGG